MTTIPLSKRTAAEVFGTFWLVFGGCGSAVLAAKFLAPGNASVNLGIGFVGVAFAFGLTVLTMAYAIGHISGCHLNPARSTAPAIFAGGWAVEQLWLFWLAPIVGAVLAGLAYRWLESEATVESLPPVSGEAKK